MKIVDRAPADLSIIEFAKQQPETIVISDDRAELEVLHAFKINAFQLSEFILFLVVHGVLKKRKARQDAVAAAEILQDFFACGGPDSAPRADEIPDG